MSASTQDLITDVRNAARPVSTTVSSPRSSGGTSLSCNALTGWPTASKVHFVTYQIDSNSNPIVGTQLDCSGIVSGNTIGSLSILDGTDNGNSIGDVVEMLPTASWGQDLATALTSVMNRAGGLLSGITITLPTIASFLNANHNHTNAAGGGVLTYAALPTGAVVQVVNTVTGAFNSGTTTIPHDDTIPQITEGDEYMTLAITPKSATNKLLIEATAFVSNSAAVGVIGALFQDSNANAIAVGGVRNTASGEYNILTIKHTMTAATTSSTTFRVRIGGDGAGTTAFNGDGGARKFGGVSLSSIVITEYNG